ncbi:MAG: hypothetical protein Alis3KO_40940 [Aliiglaciecola sp.]
MDNLYNSGLAESDWHSLKNAVCGALHHNGKDNCKWYTDLPNHLKEHEVGKLVYDCLYKNDKTALDKAAKLLTDGSDKAWLALFKS